MTETLGGIDYEILCIMIHLTENLINSVLHLPSGVASDFRPHHMYHFNTALSTAYKELLKSDLN